MDEELAARRGSYASAFLWNVGRVNELLMVILPLFLFWDALAMMLLGMALYKTGILLGNKSRFVLPANDDSRDADRDSGE